MIVIGRDTRESGPELEAALVEGIVAAGGVAVRAGILSTPGVAVSPAGGRPRWAALSRPLTIPIATTASSSSGATGASFQTQMRAPSKR